MRSTQYLTAVAALVAPTLAQTFTNCNPLQKTCPADPALGKSVQYDFTKGAPSDFTVAAGKAPIFNSSGAYFSISQSGEAPTLSSNWFIMFGNYKALMKPAPGAGIVSSLVLQSDDLDEVDWEWVGSQNGQVQTNYFGKGNTEKYDRGATLNDPASSDGFNTYEIDWTADALKWIINGKTVRTLTPATADTNQYPQTPMQLKLGNWAAGDSPNSGTSQWAGGKVDYSQGPFNMIVKSIQVTDYSTGKSYSYGDMSGTWESIKSNGGKVSGSGSVPVSVSTASASGSSITASATASALTNQQAVSATTTNSAQIASGAAVSSISLSSSTGYWNTTYTSQAGSTSVVTGTGPGTIVSSIRSTATGSGSGTSPTTSSASGSGSPVTSPGAGSIVRPAAYLAGAGLFAVLAL